MYGPVAITTASELLKRTKKSVFNYLVILLIKQTKSHFNIF